MAKNKMGMKMHERIYQGILWILLIVIALTMILPFLYVVILSFTDASAYEAGKLILWPKKWSAEAYRLILSGNGFLNALKSTLLITGIGTPCSVLCNAGLAYMLSNPFRERNFFKQVRHVHHAVFCRYGTELHERKTAGTD